MTNLEKARNFFADDRYATEVTGILIEEVGEGYAKCSLKIDSRHLNAVGHPMGGVIYTLADFTFAVSINFNSDCVTVTTVGQICYLSAVKGDMLYCESKILRNGKTTCFYEMTVTDNSGTKIAIITITGTHLHK